MSKPEKDSLGDRMKNYENAYRFHLSGRLPLILRIDGKAFHTYTRGFIRPFDPDFMELMLKTTQALCEGIQGVKLAYWQSDEISLFITDYDTLTTQAPYDKNLQKLVSISASIATAAFNYEAERANLRMFEYRQEDKFKPMAHFDSRAFILPHAEVCNYFLWRQQDATRNSINSVGQSQFSPKQLHGLCTDEVQELLFKEKGINWNDLPVINKRGACVLKGIDGWYVEKNIPVFSQDREFINHHVNIGD
jgi:tRNA(His) guanylyltransferase